MENSNSIPIKIVTKTKKINSNNRSRQQQQQQRFRSNLKSTSSMSSMSRLTVKLNATNNNKKNNQQQQEISKKDDYTVRSKSSLLKDIKNTAINGISNVQKRFNSFSMLLKPNKSKSNLENYYEITNELTPVKLYSPFTIETPTAQQQLIKPNEKLRLRQQLFTSPRNKFKDDIENLNSGINQLNLMAEKIPNQYRSDSASFIDSKIWDEDHVYEEVMQIHHPQKPKEIIPQRNLYFDRESLI